MEELLATPSVVLEGGGRSAAESHHLCPALKLGRASVTGDEGEEGNRREGEGKRRLMGRGRSGFARRGREGKGRGASRPGAASRASIGRGRSSLVRVRLRREGVKVKP